MSKPSPRDEVMVVIDKYSKCLEKEGFTRNWYGFDWAGLDKIYDGKIHEISLGYSIDKNLKYQEARRLFYRIVDNFLSEINSHEHIKNQFFHQPVTYQDLHFSLSFNYGSNICLKKGDVDQISIKYNEIFYSIADVDGAADQLVFHPTRLGVGTVTHTGLESMRSIMRTLPESEADDASLKKVSE